MCKPVECQLAQYLIAQSGEQLKQRERVLYYCKWLSLESYRSTDVNSLYAGALCVHTFVSTEPGSAALLLLDFCFFPPLISARKNIIFIAFCNYSPPPDHPYTAAPPASFSCFKNISSSDAMTPPPPTAPLAAPLQMLSSECLFVCSSTRYFGKWNLNPPPPHYSFYAPEIPHKNRV